VAQCGLRLPRRLARGPRRKRSADNRGRSASTATRRRFMGTGKARAQCARFVFCLQLMAGCGIVRGVFGEEPEMT